MNTCPRKDAEDNNDSSMMRILLNQTPSWLWDLQPRGPVTEGNNVSGAPSRHGEDGTTKLWVLQTVGQADDCKQRGVVHRDHDSLGACGAVSTNEMLLRSRKTGCDNDPWTAWRLGQGWYVKRGWGDHRSSSCVLQAANS